jgi:predicted PurR-regulated permease PerM
MGSDWQRSLVALSSVVVTATVVTALTWARSVLIPVALAIFLTFVLTPVVTRLQHHGFGRTMAVIVTLGLVVLLLLGVGGLLTNQVTQLAYTLPERHEAIKEKVIAARNWLVGDGGSQFAQLVEDVEGVISPDHVPKGAIVVDQMSPPLAARFDAYLSPAAQGLAQAALTLVLTIFMLLKREDLRNRAIRLLGHGHVTTTTKAVDDASQRISKYLFRQMLVNVTFGLVITTGLFALGVKYSILWGFIATIMRYVPYIGIWVGLIPPVLFSFATAPDWGGGWGQPLAVFVLFLGLEVFCANVVEPKVYGRSMGLSEVAQLIAAAFWAFLWGPVGLILSGPLTVCLLVLGRHVTRFNGLAVLLGDDPPLEPRVAFYQRLAARDQDEAAEVAIEASRQRGSDAVFDDIIMPALCLARHDAAVGILDEASLRFAVTAASEIAEEVAGVAQPPAGDLSERGRLLICPARDEAERVAAELLTLTLDLARWEVKVTGAEMLASELVEVVREFRPNVVVIASLPPNGISHARYLVVRLRHSFPDLKLLVGRWGCQADTMESREDSIRDVEGIDSSFAATRRHLAELYPLLPALGDMTAPQKGEMELIGTANA